MKFNLQRANIATNCLIHFFCKNRIYPFFKFNVNSLNSEMEEMAIRHQKRIYNFITLKNLPDRQTEIVEKLVTLWDLKMVWLCRQFDILIKWLWLTLYR